jgi:8-oxo-dGTP pyrophosphatase MutT (NUDIX family)
MITLDVSQLMYESYMCKFKNDVDENKYKRAGLILTNKDRILIVYGKNSKKWSFPKGRKNYDDESSLYCAIREFEEETGILLSDDELSRITFFFRTSHCVYYCLEVNNEIDFVSSPKHNHEISKVKYMRIQDLKYMTNLNYDLKVFCKNFSDRLCESVD